ncbi:MAG: signal peptidase II [Alphaproteobacteria bacterium]|jgi:signal peptidase II
MLRLGLLVAIGVIAVDQVTKYWALDTILLGQRIPVTDFFNLVLTFNPGISFSLFQEAWGRWVFSALALAIVVGLAVWLRRQSAVWLGVAGGAIIGGALGNTIDRVVHGAVVDFLDFHAFGYHWPAFNAADSAIVTGVVMILTEGVIVGRRKTVNENDDV